VVAGEAKGAASPGSSADARARDTEEQMTDEERFSLLVSVAEGTYRVGVGRSAGQFVLTADTLMKARQFGR
jgi:hypothetical protein